MVRVLSDSVFVHSRFVVFVLRGKVVSSEFPSGVLFFDHDILVHSRDGDGLGAVLEAEAGPRVGHGRYPGRVVVVLVFRVG